jgi:hypothetical protein
MHARICSKALFLDAEFEGLSIEVDEMNFSKASGQSAQIQIVAVPRS